MPAGEVFQDGPHWLVEWVWEDLERLPVGVGLSLIVDGQRLLGGLQGQPDRAALLALANPKDFIQELDAAIGGDAPDGMNAATAQRQGLWEVGGQRRGQTMKMMTFPQVVWGVRLARGHIIGVIPRQEAAERGRDSSARGEVMLVPELVGPEIKVFGKNGYPSKST